VLALIDTPKIAMLRAAGAQSAVMDYDPLAQVGGFHNPQGATYDPFAPNR
jgi:hypothetical protein